ncbi:MAG: hypothetical protein Kow0047_08310 [Anaerolineae bacterium]
MKVAVATNALGRPQAVKVRGWRLPVIAVEASGVSAWGRRRWYRVRTPWCVLVVESDAKHRWRARRVPFWLTLPSWLVRPRWTEPAYGLPPWAKRATSEPERARARDRRETVARSWSRVREMAQRVAGGLRATGRGLYLRPSARS